MKLSNFLTLAALVMFAACKPTYKATDTTTTTSGTTIVSVPSSIHTAFTTQYPTATNVVWTKYDTMTATPIDWELAGWTAMDAEDYVVRFDMDNENYYAWYDSGGNWIGSAYVIKDHTQLPAAVNTVINNKYAGYSITGLSREFQKDRVAYEIEMKKEDSKVKLLVDADGNIIKEKVK